MKYINTSTENRKTADKIHDELVKADIGKVDDVWMNDEYYVVSWIPYGKKNYDRAVDIINRYIWDDV